MKKKSGKGKRQTASAKVSKTMERDSATRPSESSPSTFWSGKPSRCGAWRAEVAARVAELEDRLAAACDPPEGVPKSQIKSRVQAELRAAIAATNLGGWRTCPDWWTGSSITSGWQAVHNAELALLQLESDHAVSSSVPRLLGWIQRAMDAGELREGHEAALKQEIEGKVESATCCVKEAKVASPDRVKIRAALMDVIAANSRRYAAVRTFRNNLILTTLTLLFLLVFLAGWHYHHIHFLTLCTGDRNGETYGCLGGTGPARSDVGMVLIMGALGGLLGIAFGFTESQEATRYDPKTWQAFLKPVAGAATALVAVIFIQSHILVELSIHKKTEVLAYALIFGFSQQLLTKFVDQKADSLITPTEK